VERSIGLEDGVKFALIVAIFFALSALVSVFHRRKGAARRKRARSDRAAATSIVGVQIFLLLALGAYYRAGGLTLESVGVSSRVPPFVALLTGVGEYFLFLWAFGALVAATGASLTFWKAALVANSRILPRDAATRTVVVWTLIVANPIAEELVFRGLLVHQLHHIGAPQWLAIALGLVANVVNHAYQGRLLLLFHVAFFVCVVFVMFSPVGLLGAIGMHFAADAVPLLGYRRQLTRYRDARRKERKGRMAAAANPRAA
jgi:membrane protease YdiL (CAAX protease family)